MWRALGDAVPAGGTKARQNRIEAVRSKDWAFASNGRGRALQREPGFGGTKQRGAEVLWVIERTGRGAGKTLRADG